MLRQMALLSLIWAIPGALAAGQFYALDVYKGAERDLVELLVADFLPWQVWALATPLVMQAGRRFPRLVPLHIGLNAAIALAYVAVQYLCGRLAGLEPFSAYAASEMIPPMLIKSTVVQVLLYWGVIAVDRGLAYQRQYREAELQRVQLEARLVEAQLDALRIQLRPHFLFNTLNAIAVLVRKDDGPGAIRMINGLGELLRRSLGTVRVERVTLREELDFIGRYVDIALARFPDRLQVTVDAEPAALDASVPCLLLQPLVENALEHGVAPRATGGRIDIVARARDDRLRIEVLDDGPGLPPDHREGIGVSHVRQRLAQLYPGRHRFTLGPGAIGGTLAMVEIPFEVSAHLRWRGESGVG